MAKGKYQEWLTPEGLLRIEGWARDGLIDEQIAKNMGISPSTLYEWKKAYPEILESLKKSKEVADREIENALFERALGGVHEVRKTFKVKRTFYDEEGRKCEKEELKTGIDEVYIPGDTTAQIFWLKNRKPEQWRDKQEVQDTAAVEKLDDILEEMRSNAIKQQTE
jgi:transcriptional regulator with XRE-family HTH domain